MTKQASQA